MLSFLILPMQRVTRLPLLLDVSFIFTLIFQQLSKPYTTSKRHKKLNIHFIFEAIYNFYFHCFTFSKNRKGKCHKVKVFSQHLVIPPLVSITARKC